MREISAAALVLGLGCLIRSCAASNGSANAAEPDLEALIGQLAATKGAWQGSSILLGMSLAFAIVGVAVFLGYNQIQMQAERLRQKNAAELMEKLDGEALKKICGNANLPAWTRYPDFERVQWLNDLVTQLWPNIKAATAGIVRERIGPQLKENKPAWISDISIQSFALGDKAPQISAIKVFNTDSVFDEIAIEMECIWNGSQKFQLAIRPFPRIPIGFGLDTAVSKLLGMRLGVADLFFKGNVRIALKPLLDRMPLVAAARVSLVDPPEFGYSLNLQGGDITFLPGLEAWLNSFIKSVVLGPYILPEGITIPIDPEATKARLPRGILNVKILEARHVPWIDWLTFPTTYVRLGVRGRLRQRTIACKHSFSPSWGEEFMQLIHEPDRQDLKLVLFSQQEFTADKIIGQASLPVTEMPEGHSEEKWITLDPADVFKLGNPVTMGLQGVQTVRDVARDAIHLPFNLKGRKQPEIHIKITYHEIEEEDVTAAKQSNGAPRAEDGEQDAELVRMLRGGILLVKVRKEQQDEGLHVNNSTEIVEVSVGGQTKGTAATYGEEDPSWDEMIEFALPGDVLDREDEQVEIKVWDTHWVNKTRENLTWDAQGKSPEGMLKIPLRKLVEEGKIEDTFRLENLGGSVDLEITWMPLLN